MSHVCHVHVINIINYCNRVPYYDMYTTLTLKINKNISSTKPKFFIIIINCLYHAPYNLQWRSNTWLPSR